MPVHATNRHLTRLLAAGAVLFFIACAADERGPESELYSPQLMGMGNGPPGDPCADEPPYAGSTPLNVTVVDSAGTTAVAGAVVVVVHPDCGPIRDGVTNASGFVSFTDLSPTDVLVTARISVDSGAPEVDIAPPRLDEAADIDLPPGAFPTFAATLAVPDGTDELVTPAAYLGQLLEPAVEIKNPSTDITIMMVPRAPVTINTFNLDVLATNLPLAALVKLGEACEAFDWLDQDLCSSGAGPAYLTSLDRADAGGGYVNLMAHQGVYCSIEVLGEQDGVLIAASAPCPAPGDTVPLFPRPALCKLIDPPSDATTDDPNAAFGSASLYDGPDANKGIDWLWVIYGAPPLGYPSGSGTDINQEPLETAIAFYGDFMLRSPLPLTGQFKAKETLRKGANSTNAPFLVESDVNGDVRCSSTTVGVQVFCASDGDGPVRFAIVHSGLSPRRLDYRFGLDQAPGGDKLPNPDQGGGFSLQPVPAPDGPCDYEYDNSRFSVSF